MVPLLDKLFDWSQPALIAIDTSGSCAPFVEDSALRLREMALAMSWPALLVMHVNGAPKGARRELAALDLRMPQDDFQERLGSLRPWFGGDPLDEVFGDAAREGLLKTRRALVAVGDFFEEPPGPRGALGLAARSGPQCSISALQIGAEGDDMARRWIEGLAEHSTSSPMGAMSLGAFVQAVEALQLRREIAKPGAHSVAARL